ncbi:MAG: hypothetical protein ABNH03_16385 [Alteromonas sp.]|tara:strand:+ start:1504 stop:1746 length:243 start_codon:yes stop_codon:yes gene_type:complete
MHTYQAKLPLKSLPSATKSDLTTVAKLAAPHFSEGLFNPKLLEKRVDDLLLSTGLDKIDTAQWMWRRNPMDDGVRIPAMR